MVKCIHDTDIITISRNVFSLTLFAVCMLKNKKNKCGEVERESVTTLQKQRMSWSLSGTSQINFYGLHIY